MMEQPLLPPRLDFSPDPEKSATLPAHFYSDPAIFTREMSAIYHNGWVCVGTNDDVSEPGKFTTTFVGDQPILIVRKDDGELAAHHNVCQHRGHVLATGCGQTRNFVCPYHAWTYGLDGRLRSAPHTSEVAGFDKAEFPLSSVRVGELGRLIFVNLNTCDDESVHNRFAGLVESVDAVVPGWREMIELDRETLGVDANWKFIHDGIECYHCPHLHPQFMGREGYATTTFDSVIETHWSLHIAFSKDVPHAAEPVAKDVNPNPAVDHSYVWFIWPNVILVARPGPANLQVLCTVPLAVDHTDRFMQNFGATTAARPSFSSWRDVAWDQDKSAMESQQVGVRSIGYQQGRLVVDPGRSWFSEHGTHHFQHLVWSALRAQPAANENGASKFVVE